MLWRDLTAEETGRQSNDADQSDNRISGKSSETDFRLRKKAQARQMNDFSP